MFLKEKIEVIRKFKGALICGRGQTFSPLIQNCSFKSRAYRIIFLDFLLIEVENFYGQWIFLKDFGKES